MDVRAKAKFIRISPKKVRLVADLVREMKTDKAIAQLNFTNKKATKPIKKLIDSAIANATNNYNLDKNNLFVKEVWIDEGPTLHRWMPRAHGRATPIRKRTSHIALTVGEIKDSGEVEPKKQEVEEPVKLEDLAKQGQEDTGKKKEKKTTKKEEAKKETK